MYAVIEAGGAQHRVKEGDLLVIDRLSVNVGDQVELDKVLLIGGEEPQIGSPYIEGVKVLAEVVDHHRGDKVDVFKYKRRHRYRKSIGFRAAQTTLRIQSLQA